MYSKDQYTHHNPQENPDNDAVQQALTDTQGGHAKLLPKPIAEASEVETGDSKPFEAFSKPIGQFGTKDFTVAFWLKTTEKGRLFDLAGNRTAGSHGNFICIRMTGKHESAPEGRVSVEVDQDGNGTNYAAVNGEKHNLNDGHWHHVAAVRQGSDLKLYIDGKLSAQERGNGIAAIENGNEFRIGRSYPEGINAQVKYNHFRIYEVALSDQAIACLYEQDCCSQLPYQPIVKQEQEVQVGEPNEPFVSFGRKVGQFETRDFTISFWFTTAEKTRYFDLAGNRVCGSHGNFVCIRMSGDHESLPEGTVHLEVDQEEDGTNYISVMSTERYLNDGRWHHVAAVRKDRNLKLYIDGKLSNGGFGAGTADISNGRDFRLGRSYPHFANVKVKYQYFSIYEVAFSDKEVGCLFEQASKWLYIESKNEPIVECIEMDVDENTPHFSLGKNVGQFNTRDFTVSFWFQTTTKSRYFDLVGNRTAGSHGNFFCVRMAGQHESMPEGSITAEVDQNDYGTNYIYVSSKRKGLNDGKWHHVAVVRSGILLELYVDGRLNAQDRSKEVTNIGNANEFRLGKSYSGFDNVRIGYRNLAIYETALSDEDIENIFEKKF